MVGDHSRQMKTQIWTVGDVGNGVCSLPIPITNKHGVSRKHESLLSRISCPRRKKNDMVFIVDLCFFRMENLELTSARTQMYWERRSRSSGASMLLYKCCYICVQDSISGALSISRQVHNMENLGQTSGDYPVYRQNLGWSRKSKIPDRLGFSRHKKNRLYPIYRQNLGWSAKRKIPDRLRIFRHTKKQSLHQWVHFTGGTIDLSSDYYYYLIFFILWHGQIRKNPSTPQKRMHLNS